MSEAMTPPRKTYDFSKMASPREHKNSEAPGSYKIASLISETVISPGQELRFEQYITGYGEIKGAKIQCYISSDVFDATKSSVECGIGLKDGKNLYWGKEKKNIDGDGFRMSLEGISDEKWEQNTLFIDASERINSVLTEVRLNNAPYQYRLTTKNKVKSGVHYIDFYLTYFNGREWITNKERVEFKIKNFFEKHNKSISWLAIVASSLAIVRLAVIPFAQWVISLI